MGVSSPWTSPFSLPDCRTEIREQFEHQIDSFII